MVALGPDFALRRGNEDEIARENSQFNCNTARYSAEISEKTHHVLYFGKKTGSLRILKYDTERYVWGII